MNEQWSPVDTDGDKCPSFPSHWRWKLLSSSGSPLRLIIPETTEETLSLCFYCGEKNRNTVMRYQTLCFAASLLLWRKRVPSIWWDSQEYTQTVTLTIHSLKAKSNVSICVRERLSALTFELLFPWNGLSIRIKGMKRSDFQRTMCFNLTIPNMFQCENQKQDSVGICQVYFFSSHILERPASFFHDAECRLQQFITNWDFRLAYLVLSRFQNIQTRFINLHSHAGLVI